MKKYFVHAAMLMALVAVPAVAQADDHAGVKRYQAIAGVNNTNNSLYGFISGVMAVDGAKGLAADGWLVRGGVAAGAAEYDTTAVTGASVDDDFYSGDLMVGYQHYVGANRLTAYVGLAVEDREQSPRDLRNSVDGSEAGVKVQAEWAAVLSDKMRFNILGHYSTVYDSYWGRTDLGYDFGFARLGPEVSVVGNDEFDQHRLGGFAAVDVFTDMELRLSAGKASTNGRGDDGRYAAVNLFSEF